MKEIPMIFNGDMVRAILEGRKTQTRRMMKPGKSGRPHDPLIKKDQVCPFGEIGDRIWVRETFSYGCSDFGTDRKTIHYRADGKDHKGHVWTPSIHMPRWACRIVLEIVAIRVERLCEISHEDAISEGCQGNGWKVSENCKNGIDILYPCMQFKELWNSIYGNWDENPWVWVIEFRRVR